MPRCFNVFAALLVLVAPLLVPSAVHAAAETHAEPLVTVGSVFVETYSADGASLISRQAFGPETVGKTLAQDAIGIAPRSGTSAVAGSAGGCRRVTVVNEGSTWIGATAYKFNTWTYWCWTRSIQVVSKVSVGWSISEVDSQYSWQGIVNTELDRYDYATNDGHPYSAFKHYRQGRFENCAFKFGCLGSVYPANTLRSYYDGTWAWRTEG